MSTIKEIIYLPNKEYITVLDVVNTSYMGVKYLVIIDGETKYISQAEYNYFKTLLAEGEKLKTKRVS